MADDTQHASEIASLHRKAGESRLKSIETQLALAVTFCAVAETEIRYARLDEAIKVLNKVRHHAETISIHLDEPGHLPWAAVPDLRKQLVELNKRIDEIELRIRQS